ncbi:unnamed protein product [Triticum turgidum subsp. durum]|uniref:BTB domain-containing protein n=1 Tax=Triticum turgidum subsp. durum TaxID=4567 RepID=A0A9R1A7P3_TRITD|nr:unnamed protein product [Triticum turgidum subsp. durum]
MEVACTSLTDVVRSVQLLKINGYSMIKTMDGYEGGSCIKSRWNVYGYDWEVQFYPAGLLNRFLRPSIALKLVFLGEARTGNVRASLGCQLVDPSGKPPWGEMREAGTFKRPHDCSSPVLLVEPGALLVSGCLINDAFNVKCTITVLKEMPGLAMIPVKELDVPPSNLHQHLGELLESETGADVMFLVSGESFAAHKAILAARSPVLMAEFFGQMRENRSRHVEINDMEAEAFKVMLHFIYTDTAPGLADHPSETVMVMTQHLLAAADRYALDRLKLICEYKLSDGLGVNTAATTLAFAERHSCSLLKAKCLEFIVGTSTTLDAVMATEGYRHLEASCPLVLRELLKSARGRKRS